MTDLEKAARMALETLEHVDPYIDQLVDYSSTAAEWPLNNAPRNVSKSIIALRKAINDATHLEQAQVRSTVEQAQPVTVMTVLHLKDRTEIGYGPASAGYDLPTGEYKLYTAPPPRQPLTDEQADELVRRFARYELLRAIEAAHGIKGEA